MPWFEFVDSFDSAAKRTEEKQFFITEYDGKQLGGNYIYKWFDEMAVDQYARS